jgi:outer membrane protein
MGKRRVQSNIRKGIFIAAALFLVQNGILPELNYAQESEKNLFDLNAARQYAINHNYDVQNSRLDIAAARKQLKEVVAGGLPQVSGSVNFNDYLDIPTSLIPGEIFGGEPGSTIPVKFGKQYNATWGVSANQLIFSGSYFVGLQASKIYLNLVEENLERSQLNVKELVTQTYYLVLVTEENLDILEETLKNLEKIHYEIQELFKEGFVEETDVKQLQISVTQLKSIINTVKQQIDVITKLLKYQMGIDLDKEITLTENLDEIMNKVNIPTLLDRKFVLEQNINYRLLNSQVLLSRKNLLNEKMKFLPTISGFATYQRNAQRDRFNLFDPDEDWYPTTIVGLSINVPIFSSGARMFSMQQARVEVRKAEVNLRKAEQGLRLQYAQAKTGLISTFENYKNAEANVELASDVYNVTLEKYREGVSTSQELTQTHNQYLTAQSEYITAKSELLNAKNKIDKLLENY